MSDLQTARVLVLRDPDLAAPDPASFARAGLIPVDVPLCEGADPAQVRAAVSLLSESTAAVILACPREREEQALADALAELTQRPQPRQAAAEAEAGGEGQAGAAPPAPKLGPIVLAHQAVRVRNAAALLVALERSENPLSEVQVGLVGDEAQDLRELLLMRGLTEARLRALDEPNPVPVPGPGPAGAGPGDDAGQAGWPEELDLIVLSPGTVEPPPAADDEPPLPGARPTPLGPPSGSGSTTRFEPEQGQRIVRLLDGDEERVLPFLVRGLIDADAPLPDTGWLAGLATALARLAHLGELPPPQDMRLLSELTPTARAEASGDGDQGELYRQALLELRSPLRRAQRPALDRARTRKPGLIVAEGEARRALRAARAISDQGLAETVLLGDQFRVEARAKSQGIPLKGIRVVDPKRNKRRPDHAERLVEELSPRLGVTPPRAEALAAEAPVFATCALLAGDAQAALVSGRGHGLDPLGLARELARPNRPRRGPVGLHVVAWSRPAGADGDLADFRALVLADTCVHADPTSEDLAAAAVAGADAARRLLAKSEPRVAFVGFASVSEGFDHADDPGLTRVLRARDLARAWSPGLAIDGPLRLGEALELPEGLAFSALGGDADVLVLPGRDAARIALELWRLQGAESAGAVLGGVDLPLAVVEGEGGAEDLELAGLAAIGLAATAPAKTASEGPDSQGQPPTTDPTDPVTASKVGIDFGTAPAPAAVKTEKPETERPETEQPQPEQPQPEQPQPEQPAAEKLAPATATATASAPASAGQRRRPTDVHLEKPKREVIPKPESVQARLDELKRQRDEAVAREARAQAAEPEAKQPAPRRAPASGGARRPPPARRAAPPRPKRPPRRGPPGR